IERGLDPAVPRLFIIDGSKALAKAIRHSFGRHTPIQRCQIHKARNIIENMMGTVRRVTRNVKRWSSSSMALRWTAAAMNEAKKGFRRLKAYKQLPALRVALAAHYEKETNNRALVQTAKAAYQHSRKRSLHKVQQSTG